MYRVDVVVRKTRVGGVKRVELRPGSLRQALACSDPIAAIA